MKVFQKGTMFKWVYVSSSHEILWQIINHANQKQSPQKNNMPVITFQHETSGKNHIVCSVKM